MVMSAVFKSGLRWLGSDVMYIELGKIRFKVR